MHSPDLSLRKLSRKLTAEELRSRWFLSLLRDMFETLYSHPSAIGLAAPQVGVQIQLAVLDVKRNGVEPLVLINPQYRSNDGEQIVSTEACLSVSGVVGDVLRYRRVEVTTLDLAGCERVLCGEEFLACALQHEIDHLQGVLYIDKLIAPQTLQPQPTKANRLAAMAMETLAADGYETGMKD